MDKTEDEFVSLQDAIALVTDKFGKNSNITKILEAVMSIMISDSYKDEYFLNEIEGLCR
jgi:hypothetical protein